MKKVPYLRDTTHTYRQQIADFITSGKWKLTNYFSFAIEAVVNGQPVGQIDGKVTGENYGYCIVCGTSIIHHYTVTDSVTNRSVNVGCECIVKIFKDRGKIIASSLRSLQQKVKSDYMRPFKHDLLVKWLDKISKTDADEIRGSQVIVETVEYNEKCRIQYLNGLMKDIPETVAKNLPEYQKRMEMFDYALNQNLARMIEYAHQREGIYNYWKYHAYMFSHNDWNPDNMRRQYKIQAEKYDTELPPNWSEIKLTKEQKKELNQKIVDETNKYIEKLNKNMVR